MQVLCLYESAIILMKIDFFFLIFEHNNCDLTWAALSNNVNFVKFSFKIKISTFA